MTIPYTLSTVFDTENIDPNNIVVGRSFYFSDASPQVGRGPTTSSLVEYDANAVAGQIEMVIGTLIGTEEFEPTFGCDVLRRLFDNLTQANMSAMELEILDALRKWLSARLDFLSVTCSKNSTSGDVYVLIPYRIRLSGDRKSYVGNLSNMAKSLAA